MSKDDFGEIGHTGGKVTFLIESNVDGHIRYATRWTHSRPTPATLCAVYVHPDGFVCGTIVMGGMGQDWSPPPFPDCIAVMMASDSEGCFGHECPSCTKHFRTSAIPATFPLTCPYCGIRAESFRFLTPPQNAYIEHYLEKFKTGIADVPPNSKLEIVIDMDAIADAIPGKPRPDFYPASITQQTRFKCAKCDGFNDVRGRYAYCADCGWRNNKATAEDALRRIREKLNADQLTPAEAVKQAVSEFDSVSRNFVDELERRVPMKATRRKELQSLLFHRLEQAERLLKETFAIDFLQKLDADRDFIMRMFLRRHVYEHDGGVATARYIKESGDTVVKEGDLIRETKENAHNLVGLINRMLASFDDDFHEIFPPHEQGAKMIERLALKRSQAAKGRQ
ncbi:MAG: hypothetical protein ABL996_18180 [Micropepsaceae bacterium]